MLNVSFQFAKSFSYVVIETAFKKMRESLGELPIVVSEQRLVDEAAAGEEASGTSPSTTVNSPVQKRVLADGTYATQSALTAISPASKVSVSNEKNRPPLRSMMMNCC